MNGVTTKNFIVTSDEVDSVAHCALDCDKDLKC